MFEAFRDFADAVDTAIVLVTPERRIVYLNRAAHQLWGDKEGSLCYRTLRDSRRVCSDCPLSGVVKTLRVGKKELRMHTADGWHTYENLYVPLRGPHARPQLVALLSTNVDYQKRLEREVAMERELSRALLTSLSTIVIGVDGAGRVEFVNRAGEQISGYTEGEIAEGGGLRLLVPEESRDEVDRYLDSIKKGTEPHGSMLASIMTGDRKERAFSWSCSSLLGADGRLERALIIGQDVTERVLVRVEAEKRALELEIVNEILKKAGTSVAVEEMLDATLSALLELPGYRCGVAYLIGEENLAFRRLAMLGFAKSEPPRSIKWVEREFPATAVYGRGIEHAWPDTKMHPAVRELLEREGLKGVIAVPLVPGGQPVGMLLLGHDFSADGVEEDRSIMEAAAEAFDLGAESMFLRARAGERAREASALYRVARSITEEVVLDRTLERVAEEAAGLFKVDISSIFLYDEETGLLVGKAGVGAEVGSMEIPLEESGTASEAARTLKPVIVDDAEADRRVPRFVAEEHGVRSSLVVPLVVEGKFAGAFFLDMKRKRQYSKGELELIGSFAEQAAMAIRNASLLDDLKKSEEKYRLLVESAEDIVFTTDAEAKITFMNESVIPVLGRRPEELLGLRYLRYVDEKDKPLLEAMINTIFSGGVIREGHLSIRDEKGSEVLLDLKINPLVIDGRIAGAVGIARDVTGRVRAEETLRESEEKYRSLVENALFGVFLHDGENLLYVNDKVLEITGYSRHEINSMEDILNLLVPEEREVIADRMTRWIAGEETPRIYDTRIRRKDGSIAFIQLQNTLMTLGGRNVIMVAVNDITDRVRAEEAVKASEERYRTVVESSQNAVMITSQQGEIIFANRASELMSGLPREKLAGRNVSEFIHPDEREEVISEFYRLWKAGGNFGKRLIRTLAGGREKYLDATTAAIGEPRESADVLIIANDVTERELAQRRLRESEERYRTIVEASRDAILMVNRGGEVLYANPEVEAVFGVRPEDVVGRHIYRGIHPDDREKVAEGIARDYKRGTTRPNFPVKCLRPDGTTIHVEVNTGLVGWPGDDALEIFVVRDVTERKEREEERELRLRVEEALADTAARFVNPGDIYEAMAETLRETGELLGIDRAHYVEFSEDGKTMSIKAEWVSEGTEQLRELRTEDFSWLVENLGAGRTLMYSDIEEVQSESGREILRGYSARAAAAAPIYFGERLAGLIGYHDVRGNREWSVPEAEMLRETAETMSRALERRAWVEELGRSERFLTNITESVGDGLIVLRNGVVTWLNRRAAEILGYEPEEMIGRTTEYLFPDPERLEEFARETAAALVGGERCVREGKAKRKDGSFVDVRVSVSLLGELEEGYTETVATITDITESKRMREQVDASAEAYSTIFAVAGDGLIVNTIDGQIRDVNERVCAYTGYSRDELLSKNVVDLVPEKVRHLYSDRRVDLLRDGYTAFETRLLGKGGATRPVEITGRMTTVLGEEVVLSAVHDISERKKAEAEMKRRAVQLASLNEILRAATSSLDLEVVVKEILRASLEFSGAESGVLILEDPPGAGTFKVMAHEGFSPGGMNRLDMDASKKALAELASGTEGAVVIDVPQPSPPGMDEEILELLRDERLESALFVPLLRDGRVMGVLGLASKKRGLFNEDYRDFYNAAGAEMRMSVENALIYRELAAEHERLALLYRSTQDISGRMDMESLLNTVAREATEAIGGESALLALVEPGRDEFVWRAAYNLDLRLLEEVHLPLDRGVAGMVLKTRRARSISPGAELTEEEREDPVSRRFEVTTAVLVPVISGDKIVGVLGVQGAGGDRTSDEDILLLEAMGRHAGVAIENARLYEETKAHLQALEVAHKELMELDRMKSDFVSTVSHELRSPLAVIEGFARTLVEHFGRVDRDTERGSLEIILKKSMVLEGLIANILDMSRIEAGRLEVNLEVLDLPELCRRVVGDQERVAEVHELKLVAPDKEVAVVADPDKVEVVLGNLLRNAVKFSPDGGAVTVAVREAGDTAEASVTDEGIGIAPEEQEKIFDRFYQVDRGETRSFPGTGLGLYISSELLRAMGGTIMVVSEPGKGSTFTFTLPLAGREG